MSFTYRPSYGAKQSNKPLVNMAAFGDGYSQRAAKGINNNPGTWSLTFSGLDAATALAIDAQLAGYGGYQSFTWVDLDGVSGLYICPAWEMTYEDEDKYSISATFQQVYGG